MANHPPPEVAARASAPAPILRTAPNGARPPPAIAAASTASLPRAVVSLKSATRGILRNEPLRILEHGPEGVGKSTFGANAPRAIILGAEDGTAEIPVYGRVAPASWEELIAYIEQLTTEEHDYQTVVIDSLDWLEPMAADYVCRVGGKKDLEQFGYGKGAVKVVDQWRDVLIPKIKTMQAVKRLNVIAIAHSELKTFKNPDPNQGDYDRFQLKLNPKVSGLWKEWAKAVIFMNYERATVEVSANRHKGTDTGARKIYTRMTAAYDAKNRYWLPAEMNLSWASFYREVKGTEELRARFGGAVMGLDETAKEKIQEEIESHDYDLKYIEEVIERLEAASAPRTK